MLGLLRDAKFYHSADPDVAQQTRRLELALNENGWRGNVEMMMEKEMRGERLPKKFLRKAPFERPYPDDHMSALEIAEQDRLASIERERAEQTEIDAEYAEMMDRAESKSSSTKKGSKDEDEDENGTGNEIDSRDAKRGTAAARGVQTTTMSNDEAGDILGALNQLRASIGELRGTYRSEDKEAKDAASPRSRDSRESKGHRGFEHKGESKGMRDLEDDTGSVASDLTHDDMGHW